MIGGQVDRWNHVTGAWNPVFRYAYTYDRKGNAISETEEKWDPQSGSWSEVGQYAYTYDNHGNTIESQYIPATAVPDAEYFLVFYYNNMQSSVGYYIGDTGTFPGANGTAEYFRLKR